MNSVKTDYYLDNKGSFVVENYNSTRPFSGFLPGIAGLYGRPLWAFYVNRGQCITSFGVNNRNGAILEFHPANKSYTYVNTHGFRTFLKIVLRDNVYFYEPFKEGSAFIRRNSLTIGSSGLAIHEKNDSLGIEVKVRYFCVPNEPFAGIARELKIINNNDTDVKLDIIDGLPNVFPSGLDEWLMKGMCNTIPAWIEVLNLENKIPFYKLKVVVADKPVVTPVKSGNFYLGYYYINSKVNYIQPIVDPSVVFGPSMDFSFCSNKDFRIPEKQTSSGIIPSAMGYARYELKKGKEFTVYSLIGHIKDIQMLKYIEKGIANMDYFDKKDNEAFECVEEIKSNMLTQSGLPEYDQYCRNTYLDNVIRGGYPLTIKDRVLYLFSRKHGDIERDYNAFFLQSGFFSIGDGNFRDVCQNRRNDVWFNPLLKEENIFSFVNLLQLDGFNPLILKGERFIMKKIPADLRVLKNIFQKPFTLGEVFDYVETNNIKISRDKVIKGILANAEKDVEAVFGEGYWIDHWTYINDLLDAFKAIYPDRFYSIFNNKNCTFYDSYAVTQRQADKIAQKDGKYRQYGGIVLDEKKKKLIESRKDDPNKVRAKFGRGDIYKTTLLVKLLCLIANKAGSFDSNGVGIEMEAGRPGWCDSLNGLPGLFGSSTCEMFELKRMVLLVMEVIQSQKNKSIGMPVEIADFLKDIRKKEIYREKIKYGISGKEKDVKLESIQEILAGILKKTEDAISKAYDPVTKLYHTYYINEMVSRKPIKFKQHPLPLFLEGQVHALRVIKDKKKAEDIYNIVRNSELYDKELKMYKISGSIAKESLEIGRSKVFSPGWLENESIWLHMEYKYMLELLRNGLYEEFFRDFRDVIIPFLDPKKINRNITENCSFIVSSVHPDKSLHGVGYLPRLTGATAEFIHMWLWMCIGREPFFLDDKGKLNLKIQPILPGWMFDDKGKYSFRLFGSVSVTIYNPKVVDTFRTKPSKIRVDDNDIDGNIIPAPYAEMVRDCKVSKIDIYF